jgi:hypothetical protein
VEIIGERDEAVAVSRTAITKTLSNNEALWKDPLDVITTSTSTHPDGRKIHTFDIDWLVYDLEGVHKLYFDKIEAALPDNNTKYSVGNIDEQKIAVTSDNNIYNILGLLTVASDKDFTIKGQDETALKTEYKQAGSSTDVSPPAQSAENGIVQDTAGAAGGDNAKAAEVIASTLAEKTEDAGATEPIIPTVLRTITVTKTETGWLNVRKTPDKNAVIVSKIYPGETYGVLEEASGWARLRLNDGNSGWAVTRYLK